jgi:recombination protein U
MGPANRGKAFEDAINYAIEMEKRNPSGALAFKVPNAWKVQRKYNPHTRKNEIAFAFPETKSTVDYIGIWNGRGIAFEAKSTENKYSFPFSNIEQHQLDFLGEWQQRGGISFFLIHFTLTHRTFFIFLNELMSFQQQHKRKSIPLSWFEEHTAEIKNPLRLFRELAEQNLL